MWTAGRCTVGDGAPGRVKERRRGPPFAMDASAGKAPPSSGGAAQGKASRSSALQRRGGFAVWRAEPFGLAQGLRLCDAILVTGRAFPNNLSVAAVLGYKEQ